jgi:hypothetical protein
MAPLRNSKALPSCLMSRWWLACGAGYVLAIAVLVTAAQVTEQPWYYGVSVLLTLPFGIAAVVAVFVLYAVAAEVAELTGAGDRFVDGTGPTWLIVALAIANVAVFVIAAVANVLLMRFQLRFRAQRRGAPG